jgi:hypothetical protein
MKGSLVLKINNTYSSPDPADALPFIHNVCGVEKMNGNLKTFKMSQEIPHCVRNDNAS